MPATEHSFPTIVITGASSGIGEACLQRMLARGYHVIATARKPADLERLAAHPSGRVTALALEITQAESRAALAEKVAAQIGPAGLDGLVNNAGVAIPGAMELLAPDAFRTQLDINVVSQLALTQQLLPMIRQAKGRIVNIGSASGFLTFPFNGAYAASKHALVAVTEALRMELVPWKIHVCLIEPGPVKTPIWQKKGGASDQVDSELQGHAKELYGRAYEAAAEAAKAVEQIAVEADAVAAAVEQALTSPSPKLRYLVGNAGKRRWVQRILPQSTFENLIRKLMKLPQD